MTGKFVVVSLIIFAAALFAFGQDQPEDQESKEEKNAKCKYLNEIRANFTACCKYPIALVYTSQVLKCKAECESWDSEKSCCTNACLYRSDKILTYINQTDDSQAKISIDWRGFITMFMRSVKDDLWFSVVSKAAKNCFNYYVNQDLGLECNLVPLSLFEMFDCIYEQDFLHCAHWNPDHLDECAYSKEFVDKCMDGIRFKSLN